MKKKFEEKANFTRSLVLTQKVKKFSAGEPSGSEAEADASALKLKKMSTVR